ncbi:MAG: flavin reductase family protein [Muribaculaceae bacterium]
MKELWKPGTMLNPLPAVIVTCGDSIKSNLITVAWTGTLCTDPAMLYISVRPERFSYDIIKEHMEFTVNLTTANMARATDLCGVRSGRDCDKWELTGLTPYPGVAVACPAIEQSPISIECSVRQIVHLGTHDMFIADVVNVLADSKYFDEETGKFDLSKSGLLTYSHGAYYSVGEYIGHFGYSIRKKK